MDYDRSFSDDELGTYFPNIGIDQCQIYGKPRFGYKMRRYRDELRLIDCFSNY